jgi:hypothetical protein
MMTRIVDTVHFASKRDCGPLQLADACAFIIKRKMAQKPDADRFYSALEPMLTWRHGASTS